ncbi:MAG: hypothetical protein OXE57_01975 [Alphaproteobacteria bacterium]|nr:hypothetical protein [Alphaproteobacteria bacterium]
MAYSSYGGYAFRNGESRLDRSDAVITDRAQTVPGIWPGFAFAAQGVSREEAQKTVWENPHGHVVLGDGPLHVGLYKQSDVWAWLDGRQIDLLGHGVDLPEEVVRTEDWNGELCEPVLETYDWAERRDFEPLRFAFPDGSRLDVVWTVQDNHYVYARLEQPDGVTWTGWSGYGVGAGHETTDWGYSTEERNRTLMRIWPDAIREPAV